MGFAELFLLAVGLAMDAFAVSVCKGLAMQKLNKKEMVKIGLWFGGFQAGMPAIGYFLGVNFEKYITAVDHWIAFALLCFLGINMLREAFSKEEEEACDATDIKTMFTLAVATSIDALAVGITFAFLKADLVTSVSLIGVITFLLSMVGVAIGHKFGIRYKRKAEMAGGVILILIGIKILLEHLGVINF